MAQLGLQLVVSEAEILQLVSEREGYRQAREFAKSDQIRDQLRGMGVELYDKEREWRCRDGRRGFLFTAGPSMCTLNDLQIQDRVNHREEARAAKNWALADAYRDELRNAGVELDDKSRTWRTAAGRTGNYMGQVQPSSAFLSEADIRSAVADRERARAMQDFATADELRRRLVSMGVEVYDKERIWKASDGRQGTIISGGVDPIRCNLSEADIVFRVAMREEARAQKDWQRADHVRDELRMLGVELIDAEQIWRTADGRTGFYMSGGAVAGSVAEYGQVQQYGDLGQQYGDPGMQGQPLDERTSMMVGETAADPNVAAEWQAFNARLGTSPFKAGSVAPMAQSFSQPLAQPVSQQPPLMAPQPQQQAFQAADQGYQGPAVQYQTQYDLAPVAGAAATTGTESLSPMVLSDHSIQALVNGREAVRENRNFEAADAIRDDLKQHGIEVWDKQRCWKASDGRMANIPTSDVQSQSKLALDIAQSAAMNAGVGGVPAGATAGMMQSQANSPASLSTDLAAAMALAGAIG